MLRHSGPIKSRARKEWEAARASRAERPMAPLRRVERACTFGGSTNGPVPKGPKAKPGKRPPNAEERLWLNSIVAHGCIACGIDGTLVQGQDGVYEPQRPQVHHILRGGRRMGHLWTLPLCDGHHQDGHGAPGLIARHPTKARFEERYGTELELLERLRADIGAMV
jgi:hypothetical protein